MMMLLLFADCMAIPVPDTNHSSCDNTCASRVRTQGQELLISNLPLPPFPVENAAQM